jgi:hypothetical protein
MFTVRYELVLFTCIVAGCCHGCQPLQQLTTIHVNKTRSCKYSLDAPDDERYRSKHVEEPRKKGIINSSYTVASCWSFYKKCLSVNLSAWNNLDSTGGIFIKFYIKAFFFPKFAKKIQVSLNCNKNSEYFT